MLTLRLALFFFGASFAPGGGHERIERWTTVGSDDGLLAVFACPAGELGMLVGNPTSVTVQKIMLDST